MALSQPTLFVLGAGASQHYDYPLGYELINEVEKFAARPSDRILSALESLNDPDRVKKLSELIKLFDPISIDAFVSQQSKNDSYLRKVGRFLTALSILKNESALKLKKRPVFPSDENNWYRYLFHSILPNNPEEIGISEPNFKIITFNYDVSLDYYLLSRVGWSYYLNDEQKKAYLVHLKNCIHHVYGQVRPVPWEDHKRFIDLENSKLRSIDYNSIQYWYGLTNEADKLDHFLKTSHRSDGRESLVEDILIKIAVQNHESIEIIGDKRAGTLPEHISTFITSTPNLRIIFLGFGYEKTNLKVLFGENYEHLENFKLGPSKVFYTNVGDQNIITQRVENLFQVAGKSLHGYRGSEISKSTKKVYRAICEDFEL